MVVVVVFCVCGWLKEKRETGLFDVVHRCTYILIREYKKKRRLNEKNYFHMNGHTSGTHWKEEEEEEKRNHCTYTCSLVYKVNSSAT